MRNKDVKVGLWVVIKQTGSGTMREDVGLICKIAKIYPEGKGPYKEYTRYNIEIDRDKEGNSNRYTEASVLRIATPEEVRQQMEIDDLYLDHWY